MIDIEYLERKKTELVADHVRRCGVTPLSKAEEIVIADLNYQIKALKDMQKGGKNERREREGMLQLSALHKEP